MADMLACRDYQEECIAHTFTRVAAGGRRIPNVLATGLGKTVIFAHTIKRWVKRNPLGRAMVLVHTDELVQQAVNKIQKVAPHLRVGVVKAQRNEVTAQVIVASVQSLRNPRRRAQIKRLSLGIVDECHHATARTYRAIMDDFPDAVWLGFTATLARGDKAKLSEVWESEPAPFTRGISFGIRRGYLLDVRGKRIVVPDLELSKVKKSGGDYQDAALGEAMEASYAPEIIAAKYAELASDRKGLVFWPLVEVAEHGARAFEEQGIPSAVIHGNLGTEERRLILKRLASGEIQCVHNVAVLTEGFDDPTISCVVIARPTRSAPLYQQMVGRGLRPDLSLPAGERGDCLVLDVVGASRTHDLRSLVDLSEKEIRDEIGMDEELSLLAMEEMQEEEERGAGGGSWPEEEPYVGETEAVDFDPLGRTTPGAWLSTFGGTYFLPAGKVGYVILVPSDETPGAWDVAWMTKAGTHIYYRCPDRIGRVYSGTQGGVCSCGAGHLGEQAALTEHRGLSLDMATSWAEEVMEELAGPDAKQLSLSKARWRKTDPSGAQKAWATRNGISWEGMTKGELSDLRGTVDASARIDPLVAFMINVIPRS